MSGEPLRPRQRLLIRGAILALAAVGAAAGVYVVMVVPPTPDSYYPKCTFHSLTGLHCPGCGLTRSVHSALNGRFAQAFVYNALAVVLVPYLLVAIGRSLWSWLWDKPLQPTRWKWTQTRLPWVLGITLVLFWVLRNIPYYPFTLLAPHELKP
jgi:hypothetical protein